MDDKIFTSTFTYVFNRVSVWTGSLLKSAKADYYATNSPNFVKKKKKKKKLNSVMLV